jgi:DNA processing protein
MTLPEEKLYWIGLNLVPRVGRITFQKLLTYFGSPQQVFQASYRDLLQVPGVGQKLAEEITSFSLEEALQREMKNIERYGIQILTLADSCYPPLLKAIYDPPPVLYYQGNLLQQDNTAIALVGSRKPTSYGKLVAERFAQDLAARQITVVSGLARGIDGAAHRGVLKAGGRTIAVAGCGLDIVYPAEHRHLKEQIIQQGAWLSEFPLGTQPDRMNFPLRNRIISGLALGTVVIEAGERSGSLITAEWALDQGREVFAVPGNITSPVSRGAHKLLKAGAKLVEGIEDILEELAPQTLPFPSVTPAPPPQLPSSLLPREELLLDLITAEPQHIDTIIEQAKLPTQVVSGILMQLELRGLIRQVAGQHYIRDLSAQR